MDTQCARWENDWNAIIVSVNYTKLDTKLIDYGVTEVTDTVYYFEEHAANYHEDTSRFLLWVIVQTVLLKSVSVSYLDITYPDKNTARKRSTLFYTHEGDYFGGNKTMGDRRRGFNFVKLYYCLMPEGTFPIHLIQLSHAIDFCTEHAEEYGLDMTRVSIFGSSAGAILTVDDAPLIPENFNWGQKVMLGNYCKTIEVAESVYTDVELGRNIRQIIASYIIQDKRYFDDYIQEWRDTYMRKESFHTNWHFYKEGLAAQKIEVRLPHDAMILEDRKEENLTGGAGGYFSGGVYYYEKSFEVPEDACREHWILEFEGVYRDAYIYLNDCFLASNHSGYRNFFVDLTGYLQYGKINHIKVKVCNDAMKNSRWYTGSGIYRPILLWKGGRIRIAPQGIRIETPEVELEVSQVKISASFIHECQQTTKVRMKTGIYELSGKLVHEASVPVTLFPGENPVITQSLYLRNAKLWSPDEPNLYRCEVKIVEGNEQTDILDQAECQFGIRRIQMDPVRGLRINGTPLLLRGSCMHHDNGILGAATFYDAEERRIAISKAVGFNSIRIAHQPASKAMLDACDRLGMLVMEESFDIWNRPKSVHDDAERFPQEWEKDVEAIVAKDFNHPCVFAYCIGNEIEELAAEDGIRVSRQLTNKFHALDHTRPVTNAINGQISAIGSNGMAVVREMGILSPKLLKDLTGDENASDMQVAMMFMEALETGNVNDAMTALTGELTRVIEHHSVADKLEEIMSHLDLCGYNYMMRRYGMDLEQFPDRMIVGSETNPPEIDRLWECVKKYPGCLGDFTWSGWDYIGEAGVGITNYEGKRQFQTPYPAYLAYCGDVDIIGHRRPLSYYREVVFGLRQVPYLSVQDPLHYAAPAVCTPWAVPETVESWTWPGQEGKPVRVLVYAAGDEAVLLCNGREVGRSVTGAAHRYQAEFETVYEPGELTVISYKDERELGRHSLYTAENSFQLKVELSKTELDEAGEEISFLMVELTDKNGILHTDQERRVRIETEEGLEIVGFGSADPYSKENFFDVERTLYRGKALAALRGKKCGAYCVTLSCEGCESVVKKLYIENCAKVGC